MDAAHGPLDIPLAASDAARLQNLAAREQRLDASGSAPGAAQRLLRRSSCRNAAAAPRPTSVSTRGRSGC